MRFQASFIFEDKFYDNLLFLQMASKLVGHTIKTVTVIGGGLMGSGIAQVNKKGRPIIY